MADPISLRPMFDVQIVGASEWDYEFGSEQEHEQD
jgi:hypothetical protein